MNERDIDDIGWDISPRPRCSRYKVSMLSSMVAIFCSLSLFGDQCRLSGYVGDERGLLVKQTLELASQLDMDFCPFSIRRFLSELGRDIA